MDKKFEKWNEWIGKIEKEILRLYSHRDTFNNVVEIIRNNKRIQKPSSFYHLLIDSYVVFILMTIRRQIKGSDKRSISFTGLLKEIKEDPKILSRERYISHSNDNHSKDIAGSEFDKSYGGVKGYIDSNIVEKDLNDLKEKVNNIENYIDKRIAHYDKESIENIPVLKDVDDFIEFLGSLFKKYYGLIRAAEHVSLIAVKQYDWKAIFRVPWIENEEIIDLSHTISPEITVYPGTEPPRFEVPCTIEEDGFTEKIITMYSHAGTHVDAPGHIIAGGVTLDKMPVEQFIGRAFVLDLSALNKPVIDVGDLEKFREILEESEFALLYTGWSRHWGTDGYLEGYPVLSIEAAQRLGGYGLKGVGIDIISVDVPCSEDFPVHRVLLGKGLIIIENLTNLDKLPESGFVFSCTPLKIKDGDGSPVRAVGIVG